ncbi:alpha-amylase domain protein, partial [Vibrio parahaemolyticus 12310]
IPRCECHLDNLTTGTNPRLGWRRR